MAAPSIDDILAAVRDVETALVAEQSAHANTLTKITVLVNLLGQTGTLMSPQELAGVVHRLQAHAQRLESIARDPNVTP